jgi:hypothetical protein
MRELAYLEQINKPLDTSDPASVIKKSHQICCLLLGKLKKINYTKKTSTSQKKEIIGLLKQTINLLNSNRNVLNLLQKNTINACIKILNDASEYLTIPLLTPITQDDAEKLNDFSTKAIRSMAQAINQIKQKDSLHNALEAMKQSAEEIKPLLPGLLTLDCYQDKVHAQIINDNNLIFEDLFKRYLGELTVWDDLNRTNNALFFLCSSHDIFKEVNKVH